MERHRFDLDAKTLIPSLFLIVLGLITLLSIDTNYFYQQLFFAAISIAILLLFSRIDFALFHFLDRFIYPIAILFLLVSFLGPSVRGATRWLTFAGFNIQPSELIKPFYIVSLASLFIRIPPTSPKRVLFHLGLFIVPFFMILRQPDLGNAIIFASVWVTMIILAGVELRYILGAILAGALLVPIGYELLHDYQRLRLVTFLNPLTDPKGAGYNAIQSMISVGSGMFFGRGFGRGTQSLLQFLPERHTDFIFASFSEEFGFMGAIILLSIFFFMLWRLLKLADRERGRPMVFLYLSGLFALMLAHVVINTGMNMGILPITGITLPFVSYGGSSLLALCIALGIAMAALKHPRQIE